MLRLLAGLCSLLAFLIAIPLSFAAGAKSHSAALGATRIVPYSIEGDPAGAHAGETKLRVRPLVVDGKVKDWTTGDMHEVTDRSFAVRRALRLNDALPTDHGEHWVWQRGPWLLIDRTTGKITALRLPEYDPSVSEVVWFRDLAAYCGLSASGKELYAVVAQIAVHKPVMSKKLGEWNAAAHPTPACGTAVWQREPLQISFSPTDAPSASFNLAGSSAVLVEEDDPAASPPSGQCR
ncbi:MAG TPA: hypothetical protein VFW25_13125 [Silvibacterium sp.]|nr:hypothetical protein [Silvibacterium sp.]